MSALPENEHGSAADTAAPDESTNTSPAGDAGQVRNLYAIPTPPEPESSSEQEGGLLEKARECFTPPRFWDEDTPSPAAELNRARHGTHLQSSGPLRSAAISYAVLSGVFTTKDKLKIWVRAHQARMAVFVVLLVLLTACPVTRPIVAWVLFGAEHEAFELLNG